MSLVIFRKRNQYRGNVVVFYSIFVQVLQLRNSVYNSVTFSRCFQKDIKVYLNSENFCINVDKKKLGTFLTLFEGLEEFFF